MGQPVAGWYAHQCGAYRSDKDSIAALDVHRVGQTIKFKAGFNIWENGSATTPIKNAKGASSILEYTVVDGSLMLASGVGAIVLSALF